jgi:hypothetical protein
MSGLQELIARLEKATGPDGVLDLHIRFALSGLRNLGGYWAENIQTKERVRVDYDAPEYTGSLDAALPDENIVMITRVSDGAWDAIHEQPDGRQFKGRGRTEALARRIAALKARAIAEAA